MLLDLPSNHPTNQPAIQLTNQLLLHQLVLHHAMIKGLLQVRWFCVANKAT